MKGYLIFKENYHLFFLGLENTYLAFKKKQPEVSVKLGVLYILSILIQYLAFHCLFSPEHIFA